MWHANFVKWQHKHLRPAEKDDLGWNETVNDVSEDEVEQKDKVSQSPNSQSNSDTTREQKTETDSIQEIQLQYKMLKIENANLNAAIQGLRKEVEGKGTNLEAHWFC